MSDRYTKMALRLVTCILVACSSEEAGNNGATGASSASGATGATGDKGPSGDVGPAGPAGDAGPSGSVSVNGYIFVITTSQEGMVGGAGSEFIVPLNNVELAGGNTILTAAAGVGRYTVQRAGAYLITYNLNFTNSVAASTYLTLNGSPVGTSTVGGTTVTTKRPSFASTVILKLAVGDVIAVGLTKHDEFTVTPQPGSGATLTLVPLN
ncbi:MAG: hypothetical protein BGO98_13530 [Myxococcales bacterium 68-20]|nr:hypothetical protein [Myxococcales bacterium]OJY17161.1 MAG: hypothetical protein BGO98_13530 [Myxococcales bacterium 68-20]